MILPAETDDAEDALRAARESLRVAIEELRRFGHPVGTTGVFVRAHDDVSKAFDRVVAAKAHAEIATTGDAVEERHVDAQVFPWVEDDR